MTHNALRHTARGKKWRCPLKRQVMARQVVSSHDGDLDFGPWEQFYAEFDGRRRKRAL